MRVKCLRNRSSPEPDAEFGAIEVEHDLTPGELYEVIGIEAGQYRLLSDAGDPVLFDPALFEVVNTARPSHWVATIEDGVEYAYAPELGKPGFFEDYHDHNPEARRAFNRYINRHLRIADAA